MFKNLSRGSISTPLAIGIIAVLVVVVGGGILAYQRYYITEQTPENQQTQSQNNQNANQPPETNQNIQTPPTEPFIKVLSPNGGEKFNKGQDITITWTSKGVNNVYIHAYYYDANGNIGDPGSSDEFSFNGGECRLTYEPVPASTGKYIVKNGGSGRCGQMPAGNRIKIEISGQATDIKDFSDNYFSIVANEQIPYIEVLQPESQLKEGGVYSIKWNQTGLSDKKVNIYLYAYHQNGQDIVPKPEYQYSSSNPSYLVAKDVPVSQKIFNWNIPVGLSQRFGFEPSLYKIQIGDTSILLSWGVKLEKLPFSQSKSYFTISKY